MKRPVDTLPGESLKQDVYIHILAAPLVSALSITRGEVGPLDVHCSWLRAPLGLLCSGE